MKKRVLTALLAVLLLLGSNICTFAQGSVSTEISDTANYISSMYDDADPATYANDFEAFFIARSGIADKKVCEQYLASLQDELDKNGKLTYNGEESVVYYASAALNLAVLGKDATDFYGHDIIKKIEQFDREKIKATSIYSLTTILYAVEGYKNEITDATLKTDIINAIVSQYSEGAEGKGFDNWGYSTDTNAKVISALLPYYGTSDKINSVIDNTSEWLISQISEGGFNYNTSNQWNAVNADSTGLGLAFLSVKGDSESAGKVYDALLSFKSASKGSFAYTIGGDDNYFATKDAMEGLLEYHRMLNGKKSIYNITDTAVYKYRQVIDQIDSLDDENSVKAARKAYDTLPDDFKKKVSNITKLKEAEAELKDSSSTELINSVESTHVSLVMPTSSVPTSSESESSEISSSITSDHNSSRPVSSNSSKPNKGNSTTTSDSSPITMMIIILVVSGSVILILLRIERKGTVK